jgi:hypothetical protein
MNGVNLHIIVIHMPPKKQKESATHVEKHGHVNVHDVALGERPRVRDTVADALVDRGADALGEAAVVQGRGVSARLERPAVHRRVDRVGGHARADHRAGLVQDLGGQAAGGAHLDEAGGVVRLDALVPPGHAPGRGVGRARDVRGDGARRRDGGLAEGRARGGGGVGLLGVEGEELREAAARLRGDAERRAARRRSGGGGGRGRRARAAQRRGAAAQEGCGAYQRLQPHRSRQGGYGAQARAR